MRAKRILLITVGRTGDTSYNMFESLGDFISERYECRKLTDTPSRGSTLGKISILAWDNIRNLKQVAWADTVMIHVASATKVGLLLAARLLRKKVVIFQWDVYPTTIAGVRHKDRLIHRILYKTEDVCLALAHLIVIPSDDFRSFARNREAIILPLWPQSRLRLTPFTPKSPDGGAVHIAFAGQINELRGLAECVAHLAANTAIPIVLHLFSANRLPPDLGASTPSIRNEQHVILAREELQHRLAAMHFGLVSLNPLMDQPGFPSKTFDYVAAGLPVLYFGRPLPGYTSALETCGIGIDMTEMKDFDLAEIHQTLSVTFERGRTQYLSHTSLAWSRLADIC